VEPSISVSRKVTWPFGTFRINGLRTLRPSHSNRPREASAVLVARQRGRPRKRLPPIANPRQPAQPSLRQVTCMCGSATSLTSGRSSSWSGEQLRVALLRTGMRRTAAAS
jgi:hypothetical protein